MVVWAVRPKPPVDERAVEGYGPEGLRTPGSERTSSDSLYASNHYSGHHVPRSRNSAVASFAGEHAETVRSPGARERIDLHTDRGTRQSWKNSAGTDRGSGWQLSWLSIVKVEQKPEAKATAGLTRVAGEADIG